MQKIVYNSEGEPELQMVVDPHRTCSNTILLFAFFVLCLRLTALSLNVMAVFFISLCGCLAICGAEADGLIVYEVNEDEETGATTAAAVSTDSKEY